MKFFAPLNTELKPALQEVEVATFFQLPSFQIIGLPGPEVAEARERIRAAIEASGLEFPKRKVVVNLSPSSVRKRGTGLDLSMALAILWEKQNKIAESHDQEIPLILGNVAAWGELGLDGKVKAVGQLTRVIYAAWERKMQLLFLAQSEFESALGAYRLIEEAQKELQGNSDLCKQFGNPPFLIPVNQLSEAWNFIKSGDFTQFNGLNISAIKSTSYSKKMEAKESGTLMPLSPTLERAVSTAIAGKHHICLLGPKGAGKSHAIEWLIHLQLPRNFQENLESQMILELGFNQENYEMSSVRHISTQIRPATLIGNFTNSRIRPGEFSLAHGGLLIADEFLEWSRDSREILREPLERGRISLSRMNKAVELPAQFQFIATGNLCPCGGWPENFPAQNRLTLAKHRCRCMDSIRKKYLNKLSGPILDRIDLVTWVFQSEFKLSEGQSFKNYMDSMYKKIEEAHQILIERWKKAPGLMRGSELEILLQNHQKFRAELSKYSDLSMRGQHKILRLAFTLAALDGKYEPSSHHFIEAFFYRSEQVLDSLMA